MQPRELLFVAFGAIVLTNVSILGTLFATGYFSGPSANEEELVDAGESEEQSKSLPPPEPPTPALHSMSRAMQVCESRVVESSRGKFTAYDVNDVASRFLEDQQLYQIFIDTKTASRVGAPQETAEITCEVAADSLQIVAYKAMKN